MQNLSKENLNLKDFFIEEEEAEEEREIEEEKEEEEEEEKDQEEEEEEKDQEEEEEEEDLEEEIYREINEEEEEEEENLEKKIFSHEITYPIYYILNEKINLYEDQNHEFKTFRINSELDIQIIINIIQRYFCAFLNTNNGVIYIGISDDGYITGFKAKYELLKKFEIAIISLIEKFDSFVNKNNLIKYYLNKVYYKIGEKNLKILNNQYIIEIFVKKGENNVIYYTPIKDTESNQHECFIKLNGTLMKLEGKKLFKYIKIKLKKHFYSLSSFKK
jgi:flagellar motor protein MotB